MQNNKPYLKDIAPIETCSFGFSSSKFILSKLDRYYNRVNDSPFSIKYVSTGVERYSIDNRVYKVKSNQYLLVNQNDGFDIELDSKEFTDGICIYPPENLINEVFEAKLRSSDELLNNDQSDSSRFNLTRMVSSLNSTSTGVYLNQYLPQIIHKHKQNVAIDFSEFYMSLAECIVEDQLAIDGQLKNLKSTKKQTKEELYRRISLSKDHIHDNYKESLNIAELAELACLSKYHFLRSFKDLYAQTPYQYLLNIKLNKAKILLEKGFSISTTGDLVGFSDPKNLRKALKKRA